MEKFEKEKNTLRELFSFQKLCVLSTLNERQPYVNLIGFYVNDNLDEIVFATYRSTRKFSNISANSHVSVLIDSRSNRDADFQTAIAATAIGVAEEVTGIDRDRLQSLFLKKYPHLHDFVTSPSCALMRINVERYIIVNKFQHVVDLHIK
ncbi:pyridoxamine 5'-phosphate oxidase family protein [Candidatus Latescibacterota bacterium]